MNIHTITCPLCANKNANDFEKQDNYMICKYCNSSFFVDVFESFNDKLLKLYDIQKQEQIANVRHNLWNETHAEYKSKEKILAYSKELKLLSPDDLMANFYDIACSDNYKDVNDFLNNITNCKNLKPFIQDMVEFMLTTFEEKNTIALKNLINNTFENEEKTKYITKLEEECYKLNNGVYASFLERDVFVAYSSKDIKKVCKIVDYLESQDISCFLAMRNLRHGKGAVENYQNELKTAMNNCKCFLFLSSENSRNLGCDAFKIELKYLKENLPNKKRIEYIIQDYTNTPMVIKNFLKVVFKDLEHCRTPDDLLSRIFDIIMNYEDTTLEKKTEKQQEKLDNIISKIDNINNSTQNDNQKEILFNIMSKLDNLNNQKQENNENDIFVNLMNKLNDLNKSNQKETQSQETKQTTTNTIKYCQNCGI